MSLIGIDIGSSSVKVSACDETGRLIASHTSPITPLHPKPGYWETDPNEVWQAVQDAIAAIAARPELRQDPPAAFAVSASGRENFLADAQGTPLTNVIMGADIRGQEFEITPPGQPFPEPWTLECGHLRERMDPVFRFAYWQKEAPQLVEKASYFFGWIDYINFMLSGKQSMDHSTVSRYMCYDLDTHSWSEPRVEQFFSRPDLLPPTQDWGEIVGNLKPELAELWGFPKSAVVAQGCHDLNCAAYGAGAFEDGSACLVSGSYENLLVITGQSPSTQLLLGGISYMPQPSQTGLSLIAVHPTGNAVMNWARDTVSIGLEEMEVHLAQQGSTPSPVLAVPYLSGAMAYWEDGRKARGALVGLTLASTPAHIAQAFMESIAFDTVNTLSMLHAGGVEVKRLKITGGGARSRWWTQLKADLTGVPIDVVEHPEPGTLGAALLAGLAIGLYDRVDVNTRLSKTTHSYEPRPQVQAGYQDKMDQYKQLMRVLLKEVY